MQADALTFLLVHCSLLGHVRHIVPPCSVPKMVGRSGLLSRPQEASVLAAHAVISSMQGPHCDPTVHTSWRGCAQAAPAIKFEDVKQASQLAPAGHKMAVYAVKWNLLHSRVFLSASADWSVRLWDGNRTQPVMTFDLDSPVGDVAWAPYSATVFAAVTDDGKVRPGVHGAAGQPILRLCRRQAGIASQHGVPSCSNLARAER